MRISDWSSDVCSSDLRAPFRLARDVVPHMKPGSAIINVTSTFAVIGGRRGGAYTAAKGGLNALTSHIACQYGALGIRCNNVAPGVTVRSEEHTSELQSLMRISYAVFCLKKKKKKQ